MNEYWWSSREACLRLLNNRHSSADLPKEVPIAFKQIRPCIQHGWEMVLLAAELLRPDSSLKVQGTQMFISNYSFFHKEALKFWGWEPNQLQTALDEVRENAIQQNQSHWLNLHKPFPHVVQRLKKLPAENVAYAVLTTKGTEFTKKLMQSFDLAPQMIYGHESGSKSKVLSSLSKQTQLLGFVEDRRKTLEKIISTKGLTSLPCYLATWGYLKPGDTKALPEGIRLLNSENFSSPLARWP